MNQNSSNSLSNDEIIAQLTAYLDGELDEAEVRLVEDQISSDIRYQKLLHQLQQTWDVLDVLPAAKIGAASDFTQSTMKLVVQDAERLVKNKPAGFWKWPLRVFALCVVPCLASASTFYTTRYLQQIPVQQLQSNVSVIRNLDIYAFDKNLSRDFLIALMEKGDLFGIAIPPEPSVQDAMALTDAEILNQFDALAPEQKQRIRVNFQRFRALSSAEKERIRRLHQQIMDHPRSKELQLSMRRYYQWLSTLWETQAAAILDTADPNHRIELIKEITWEKYVNTFGTGVMGLPQQDKRNIYLGMLNIVSNAAKQRQMDREILAIQPYKLLEIEAEAQKYREGPDRQKIYANGKKLKLLYDNVPERIDQLFTLQDVQTIKALLSSESQDVIDLTINWPWNSDKSEAQLLVLWMIEVFNSEFPPENAPLNITEVYDRLTAEERDRIDNQHPADRKRMPRRKTGAMEQPLTAGNAVSCKSLAQQIRNNAYFPGFTR